MSNAGSSEWTSPGGATRPPEPEVSNTTPPEVPPETRVRRGSPGRWRYMVVLGSFIVHVMMGGINRCYGVIYLQLQDRFHSNAALTAGVGGMSTALRLGAAPLATVLSERLGDRTTVVGGGLLFTSGFLFTIFIPGTEVAFLTLGFLTGVGGALIYIPSLVTVGRYFTDGLATALGVATSGSGIGVFVLPLAMEAFFENYGFQGGMLLLGGLMLHVVIAGFLYRPLPPDTKPEVELITLKLVQIEADAGNSQHDENQQCNNQPHPIRNHEKITSNQEHPGVSDGRAVTSCGARLVHALHLQLFSDKAFLSFFIAQIFCSACYWTAQMLLPPLATSYGHPTYRAMLLLSLLGVTDVIGRLGGGAIFDIRWVKSRLRAGYALLLLLTSLTVLGWAGAGSSYALLAVVVTVHGLTAGALVSLKTVMATDLVGRARLAGGLGLSVFGQGIGVLAAPPVAGLLRDVTGQYTWSFIFLGVLGIIGTLVFLFGATCRKCHSQYAAPSEKST